MKYGYEEVRRLTSMDLRSLCIMNDWYTHGTVKEYSNLLSNVDNLKNVTTDDIVEIAQDIVDHSDVHMDMGFTDIMFAIAEKCTTYFEEV